MIIKYNIYMTAAYCISAILVLFVVRIGSLTSFRDKI